MEDGGWRMEDGGWRMEDGWRSVQRVAVSLAPKDSCKSGPLIEGNESTSCLSCSAPAAEKAAGALRLSSPKKRMHPLDRSPANGLTSLASLAKLQTPALSCPL